MTIRIILPRLEIRRLDALANKMPTILRSGDPNRLGNAKITFDDTKIIVFKDSASVVSYPTLLPSGSVFATDITSSLWAQASIVKGIADNQTWISPSNITAVKPFVEEALHEQDIKTSNFYKTGSDPKLLGTNDFSTNLGNKTQIRISLPINTTTYMLAETASLYYYNNSHGIFELVGENDLEVPHTSVGYAFDTKLFGPFGNYTISGSHANLGEGKIPFGGFLNAASDSSALIGAMQYIQTGSALLHNSYAANVSQSIDIGTYITHPFLLEKAIIDIPITAGAGWLTDTTKVSFGNALVSSTSKFIDATWDYGGPAITVSLLRQTDNTHRELIMSGTITPENDGEIVRTALEDTIFLDGEDYPSHYQDGFPAYGTPGATVPGSTTITSSVRLQMIPAISNGYVSIHHNNGTYVDQTNLVNINPIGRGGAGVPSGRSIFGREFVFPLISKARTTNIANGGGENRGLVNHVNNETHAYSPYLLMPGDKIILALSKHRPVKYAPTHSTVTSASLNSTLVGSHDVGIYAGKVNITLYGSHIRAGKEYNNTLNQLLSTDSAYETIGEDPALDQFDNSNTYEYTGSYIDFIMSGSIKSSSGRVILASKTVGSQQVLSTSRFASERTIMKWELGGFERFTQAISENERYYDSLAPKITDIRSINGAATMKHVPPTGEVFALLVFDWKGIGTGAPFNTYEFDTVTDNIWTKSFPFEPRYSALVRNTAPASSFLCTKYWVIGSAPAAMDPQVIKDAWVTHHVNSSSHGAYHYDIGLNYNYDISKYVGSEKEITKWIYGFGRRSTCHYDTGQFIGTPTAANVRGKYEVSAYVTLQYQYDIRGWKYGLLNGLPQHSKVVFRRDRFGQLRDMLEQRLDGKMYDVLGIKMDGNSGGTIGELHSPIQVKFIGPDNRVVRPEYTYSSNLSFESTSSLPFCDGLVFNREEPIDTGQIGTTTVVA